MLIQYCKLCISTGPWQSSDHCYAKKTDNIIYVHTRRQFYVCAVHPLKETLGALLLSVMVSISRGFMKLCDCTNAREESVLVPLEYSGCLFCHFPAYPVFPSWNPYLLSWDSQYHMASATSLPARLVRLAGLPPPLLLLLSWSTRHMAGWKHLDRQACLDCEEVSACVFVWYLNQTAARSGTAVCYQNILNGRMKAKLWVLCYVPIFCFSAQCYLIITSA